MYAYLGRGKLPSRQIPGHCLDGRLSPPMYAYLGRGKYAYQDSYYFFSRLIQPVMSAITASETWPGFSYSCGVLFPSPSTKRWLSLG
jgi:hypothetical protein